MNWRITEESRCKNNSERVRFQRLNEQEDTLSFEISQIALNDFYETEDTCKYALIFRSQRAPAPPASE